jgi:carotenoid cleavage dioxygenase
LTPAPGKESLPWDIPTDLAGALSKHDYDTGATVVVEGPDFLTSPSEPAFVPRAGAVAEDDGYLLAPWWNRQTGLSELLIRDAASLSRERVARVRLPGRVPFGFHGSGADAAVLDRATAASREAVGTAGGEG